MGRAHSLDLRERGVAAVAAGVVKWSQRFRATGSAAAQPVGGNRPYVLSSERRRPTDRLHADRMRQLLR
jgi:transposase